MRVFDQHQLDRLSAQAADNPRLRKNLNIHPTDDFCCHRLFNAVEPGSYIRPHRHLDAVKDETFIIVRGRLGVIRFDDCGNVSDKVLLAPDGPVIAVDIPRGAFHTAVSLVPGTIFFEVKAGPYRPLTEKEFPAWSPEEGSPGAAAYLQFLRSLFTG